MKSLIKKVVPRAIRLGINKILHSGDKYVCPFCGYASRDLSRVGNDFPIFKEKQIIGGGLRMGGCYSCGSIERERLIYLFLKTEFNLFDTESEPKRILHIAPEVRISKKILAHGKHEYICGDLFTPGYTYPAYVQDMNVLALPFGEATFDLVLCNHVLEHIPDDIAAMESLYRVLKPGGVAILQVPFSSILDETFEDENITDPRAREKYYGQFDHVRLYGQDYDRRLASVGFKVERKFYHEKYPQWGLSPLEPLFIGSK